MNYGTQQIADEWLVLQSQSGNARAFEQLVSRWQERLWRHARRLIHDDAAAWDVVQEAWMSMLKGLRRLEDPGAFSNWAYRIVTFKSIDHIRSGARRREVEENQPERVENPAGNDDVEELRIALAELNVEQRAILSLHYKEELGVEKISQILGVPVGTVKSRLHRARSSLKERITRRRR